MKFFNIFSKNKDNGETLDDVTYVNEVEKIESANEYENSHIDISTIDTYRKTKKDIVASLERLNEIYEECGSNNRRLVEIINKFKTDNFQIVVLGEFSRGKSTFINTLLNKNILPSNIIPTTAVLTKIHYGEEPKVIINYKNNTSDTIDINELKRYITTLETEDLANQIVDAEVYYPTQFCLDGCSIIDSPGVNDINQQKVDITYNYIPKSDAAIILLDPDQPFTESEKEFIENKIIDNKVGKLFFLLNKFDQVDEKNKEELVNYVKNRLLSLKEIGSRDIKFYCISSKEALKARLKGEDNSYNREFKKFENDLMEFLIKEKGKYIMLNTMAKSSFEVEKLEERLSVYMNNLKISLNELEDKQQDFLKIRDNAIRNSDEVKIKLDKKYNNLLKDIEFEVDMKLNEIFEQIYQMINSMSINMNNYAEAIPKVLEGQVVNFVDNSLNPQVIRSLEEIKGELNNVLIKVKNELYKFDNQSMEISTEASITVSNRNAHDSTYQYKAENQIYLPERVTSTNDIATTVTYLGGAVTAGLLVTAMITGPIGLLIGVASGGAVFKTLDNSKRQREKNFVYNRLSENKAQVIANTKGKINQIINDEYRKLENEIYNEIEDSLASYEKLFDDLIKEKKNRTREFNEIEDNIKNIVMEINQIKEKFNKITVYARENM